MYIANISWKFQAGIRNLNINFQKKICDYIYRSILDRHFGISWPSWFHFHLVFIYLNSLSLQHTFWHKYQLSSSKTRRYRQHYTLSAAILSFGRHLGFRMRYNLCPGIFLKLYILPTYPENFMLVSRSEIFWQYMTRSDCTNTEYIHYYVNNNTIQHAGAPTLPHDEARSRSCPV